MQGHGFNLSTIKQKEELLRQSKQTWRDFSAGTEMLKGISQVM
jgi:hypothetical protein